MRRLDIPATARQLRDFIRETVREAGFECVVVGLSGGLDSSTATALAAGALGPHNVYVFSLPYQDWHAEAQRHNRLLLNSLEIPQTCFTEIEIDSLVMAFSEALHLQSQVLPDQPVDIESRQVRLGNLMARARMAILFDQAKSLDALVLGTENKSEHWLGYYTRFGDEASDLEPLRNLYKSEVYQLAEHLDLPQAILAAKPTAGLWLGQTDEGQFGFSYKEADEILYGLYEAGLSYQELRARGFQASTIQSVQRWVEKMGYKSHLPYLAPEPVVLVG
jgi:NAD+ synthase